MQTKRNIIFVADFFVEQYKGGAELTLETVIKTAHVPYEKIQSHLLTPDFVQNNQLNNSVYIFGNCVNLPTETIKALVYYGCDYRKIEMDFAYCKYRSSHLHKFQTGNDCDCHKTQHAKLVYGFYKFAKHLYWMSEGQLNEYMRVFPTMNKWPESHLNILGSQFSYDSFEHMDQLREDRTKDNGKYLVLKGGSWIKNQKQTEEYCRKNGLDYDLVGGLNPTDFLTKMSEYKGLVFMPSGFDTCPRIVLEAKYLGLELVLNESVLISKEIVAMDHEQFSSHLNLSSMFDRVTCSVLAHS